MWYQFAKGSRDFLVDEAPDAVSLSAGLSALMQGIGWLNNCSLDNPMAASVLALTHK